MLGLSFLSRCSRRVYPAPFRGKRLLALGFGLALATAGCGGGGGVPKREEFRELSTRGARFSVPSGWTPTRTPTTVSASPSAESDELVSVSVFRLLRAYSPALWPRVVPELDRAANELVRQLAATMTASRTVTIAGDRARSYELSFRRKGRDVRERITFVLRDEREYELLCRWAAGRQEPPACAILLARFRPG
jgi:hypothetical protein